MPSSGLLSPRAIAASAASAASSARSKSRTQMALILPSWRSMRPMASLASSTAETCLACSAALCSSAVLKLHRDLDKAHSRFYYFGGANDAQFGHVPQEQSLYNGIIPDVLSACLCLHLNH